MQTVRKISDYRVYSMSDVSTDGARDLEGPEWEWTLVRRIREKNLAWNSEKTYRPWCRRFMSPAKDKQLSELDHHAIRDWLSDLEVKERAAVATQAPGVECRVFFGKSWSVTLGISVICRGHRVGARCPGPCRRWVHAAFRCHGREQPPDGGIDVRCGVAVNRAVAAAGKGC